MINILNKMSRFELIKWLMENDPQGCYSDQDSIREGYKPITREEALEIAISQINGTTDKY